MIEHKSSTFLSGVLAFFAYFVVMGALLFYFNTKQERKTEHYVIKNENRIAVTLASSVPMQPKKSVKKKKSIKKKKAYKKKKVIPKEVKKKRVPKRKKAIQKKKSIQKKLPPKKVKKHTANDLFSHIKSQKKSVSQIKKPKTDAFLKQSALEKINASLKNKKSAKRGVEDKYKVKVQMLLENWPAQSSYAGEKIKVKLFIKPSGFFTFKLKSFSNNSEFNEEIRAYLKQLQTFGFGPHNGGRIYEFEAEFIAKE